MSWKTRISQITMALAFIVFPSLLVPLTADAQEVTEQEERWQFEISPYLFMAGMKGESGIGG